MMIITSSNPFISDKYQLNHKQAVTGPRPNVTDRARTECRQALHCIPVPERHGPSLTCSSQILEVVLQRRERDSVS